MRRIALLAVLAACPAVKNQPTLAYQRPLFTAGDEIVFVDGNLETSFNTSGCIARVRESWRTDFQPCYSATNLTELFNKAASAARAETAPSCERPVGFRTGGRTTYLTDCYVAYGVRSEAADLLRFAEQQATHEADGLVVVRATKHDGTPLLTISIAPDGGYRCERLVEQYGKHARYQSIRSTMDARYTKHAIGDIERAGGPASPTAIEVAGEAMGINAPLCMLTR